MSGLIKAVTNAALAYYGYRQQPEEAPVEAPPPANMPEELFTYWARRSSDILGLPPRKLPQELLRSYRSWVYSCVRAISFRVASVQHDLVLNARESDAADVVKTTILDHPYLDMMWKPNPFSSHMELWLTTMNHLDLTGNAYWLVLMDKLGVPREIWPLYPQFMRIVAHPTEMIKDYVYNATIGVPIRFELDNPEYKIIHFKYPNPLSPYYGMGPLEAQAYAYDIDLYTEVYQRSFFQDGARPDFVLETDSKITKQEAELTLAMWDEHHRGPAKTWRPAILGSGMKARPLTVSNRDLAFAALAEWSADKIFAAYGVPRGKLGLLTELSRANADAADLTFNREAILPRLTLITERIDNDLLPLYPGQTKELWLGIEFENPVPADREAAREDLELDLKYGVTYINEVREGRGDEKVEWGDKPILPATWAPLGSALPALPAPAPPTGDKPKPAPPPEPVSHEQTAEEIEVYRTALWGSYVARTEPQEHAFIPDLNRHFTAQEAIVLANLEEKYKAIDAYFSGWSAKKVRAHLQRQSGMVDAILFDPEGEQKKLVPIMTDHVQAAVDEAGLHAIEEIGVGVWDLQDPAVLTWIENHCLEASQIITGTTRDALGATLLEGVTAGETMPDLVKRIKDVYQVATTARANTIARTEVNTAASWGTIQAYKQSGVVSMKEWLSSRDQRCRPTHGPPDGADGQRVGLNENFKVGEGSGPAPGHINLPEESINCRCTLIAVLAGSKSAHPTNGDAASATSMLGFMARLLERAISALTARPVPAPTAEVAIIERDVHGRMQKVTKTPKVPGG